MPNNSVLFCRHHCGAWPVGWVRLTVGLGDEQPGVHQHVGEAAAESSRAGESEG